MYVFVYCLFDFISISSFPLVSQLDNRVGLHPSTNAAKLLNAMLIFGQK